MELKEMIKVMQHYDNGGEVEFSEDYFKVVLGEANKKEKQIKYEIQDGNKEHQKKIYYFMGDMIE